MATIQGTCYGTYGSHYDIYLDYTLVSQEVSNNRSYIRLRQWARADSTSYQAWSGTASNNNAYINVDGVQKYYSTMTMDFRNMAVVELGSWEGWVDHASDGTKTVELYAQFDINGPTSLDWGKVSYSWALTTIPRATQVSLSAGTTQMGQIVGINTPRASGSFTHTVTWAFGGASGTVAEGVGTYVEWTLPNELANQVPSATSGVGTITCYTYNGGTHIGTTSVNFTATVPSWFEPWVQNYITLYETNTGLAIQNITYLSATVSEGGSYGSWITYRNTSITGLSSNGANAFTTGAFSTSGLVAVKTDVTDSRGRTASYTQNVLVVAYSSPTITSMTAFRSNSDGSVNPSGGYMTITGSGIVSPINDVNGRYIAIYYKTTGGSWSFVTQKSDSYNLSISTTIIADANYSYGAQIYLADTYRSATREASIPTGFVMMDFHANGQNMAIGKVAQNNGVLEVGGDAYFTKDINFQSKDSFIYGAGIGGSRIEGYLAGASWYRVATFSTYDGMSTFAGGDVMQFSIARTYNNLNNESLLVTLMFAHYNMTVSRVKGGNYSAITGIRWTYSTSLQKGYIDIYYNHGSTNNTVVTLLNHTNSSCGFETMNSLEAVPDNPNGEVVLFGNTTNIA